jgi:hypothetical protein
LINVFAKLVKLKVQILLTSSGNKAIEHASHQPKVKCSNSAIAPGTGRGIIMEKTHDLESLEKLLNTKTSQEVPAKTISRQKFPAKNISRYKFFLPKIFPAKIFTAKNISHQNISHKTISC